MALPAADSPCDTSVAGIRVNYSNKHRSRYNVLNSKSMPPRLEAVRRLLSDSARRHRQFPGVGIDPKTLLDQLATAIREKRGPADDMIRAFENAAILVEVQIASGDKVFIYDAERLDQTIAFSKGGKALVMPTTDAVQSRIYALISRSCEEAAPESSEGLKVPEAPPPDFDAALITLDDAKGSVPVPNGTPLEHLVVKPTDILAAAYPACRRQDLVALVEQAVVLGYLQQIGAAVFRISLTPSPPSPANANDAPTLVQQLEARIIALQVNLASVDRALVERTEQLAAEQEKKLAEITARHGRAEGVDCDQIRVRANDAFKQRYAEIAESRDKRLALLEKAYVRKRERYIADAEALIKSEGDLIEAAAEAQQETVKRGYAEALGNEKRALLSELDLLDQQQLLPLQEQAANLRERIMQHQHMLEDCKQPLP